MKEVILRGLEPLKDRQLNLASDGAREFIAETLEKEVNFYILGLVEDIITPQKPMLYPKRED